MMNLTKDNKTKIDDYLANMTGCLGYKFKTTAGSLNNIGTKTSD